jgi:hypothetical protein
VRLTPITLGDILQETRDLLAESDTTGRFSDAMLTRQINRGIDAVALAIEWPEANITQSTVAGTQEYQLPLMLKLLRVYLAGQECVPTTIPTLEGFALELYDQSTPGTAIPKWKNEPSAAYPVTKHMEQGYPVPQMPWQPGMRPRYYLRGGNLGFLPTPANVVTISCDIVPVVAKPAVSTDVILFPDFFIEPLAIKACELGKESDRHFDEAEYFSKKFEEKWLPKLRTWKEKFQWNLPRRPSPITYRSFYGGAATGRGRGD